MSVDTIVGQRSVERWLGARAQTGVRSILEPHCRIFRARETSRGKMSIQFLGVIPLFAPEDDPFIPIAVRFDLETPSPIRQMYGVEFRGGTGVLQVRSMHQTLTAVFSNADKITGLSRIGLDDVMSFLGMCENLLAADPLEMFSPSRHGISAYNERRGLLSFLWRGNRGNPTPSCACREFASTVSDAVRQCGLVSEVEQTRTRRQVHMPAVFEVVGYGSERELVIESVIYQRLWISLCIDSLGFQADYQMLSSRINVLPPCWAAMRFSSICRGPVMEEFDRVVGTSSGVFWIGNSPAEVERMRGTLAAANQWVRTTGGPYRA